MPCYFPLKGFRSRTRNESGKSSVVFSANAGYVDQPITLACGQCIGCRLERSRQWAIRCVHEASLYSDNCFITLTYDDAHLPPSFSLDKSAFQKFMKRLRKKFSFRKVRYFHCGEYGDQFGRPHYHACLFNFDFPDKVLWKIERGNKLYVSPTLSALWPFGFSTIGEVTFESAAYVARYVVKKVTGDKAKEHYTFIDPATGEWFERLPEYTTMSRRPGIGEPWLRKFQSDVYPDDFVVVRGMKMKPPKFYDKKYFEGLSEDVSFEYVHDRKVDALLRKEDSTPERLRVREKIAQERLKHLKRSIE